MKRSYEHKQNEVFPADDIIQIQSENPVYNVTLHTVLFFLCGSNKPDQILYIVPSETAMGQLMVNFKLCVVK